MRRKKRQLIPVDPKHVRLRAVVLGEGPDAGEVVVIVESFHGPRRLVVDRASILADDTIRVGAPLARRARFRLVEIAHARQRQLAWVDVRELVDDAQIRRINRPAKNTAKRARR